MMVPRETQFRVPSASLRSFSLRSQDIEFEPAFRSARPDCLSSAAVTEWTYADIWENVADCLPDAPALIHGDVTLSWSELDQRANALARFLLDAGLAHQDKVAFYLYNRPEYIETFYACSKASLVHVNTNYRYADDELVYIWDNADTAAVVFQGAFTEVVERIRSKVPTVQTWLWVDDGAGPCPEWATPYEDAIGAGLAERVMGTTPRSGDDLVFLYTGGTTGMPKGVMWRQGDLIAATERSNRIPLPVDVDFGADGTSPSVRARTTKPGPTGVPCCPLMHGTGLFNSLTTLSLGGSIATLTDLKFTVQELLDTIERVGVKSIFIVGDAFAKPILNALDDEPERWDISSLRVVLSSGVMWSSESKQGLLRHNDRLILVDAFGSSEAIGLGSSVSSKDDAAKTASFSLSAESVVVTDDGRLVEPGSGEIGKVGVRGRTPVGYYKDEEKTKATFPVIDGTRYSVPGDFATVEADGSITLLGRGSVCINTGGEKVFPEEVEEVLKRHESITDAIAVGVPDDRFGSAVHAVVATGAADLDIDDVIHFVKQNIAGYKAPRKLHPVDTLHRAANGKVDYKRWTAYAKERVDS